MANEYVLILFYLMWGLLVFTSVSFLISGLDDLFFDVYYWGYFLIHLRKINHSPKLTYQKLCTIQEKRIAVMIPCWHEAGVIEQMLKHNVYAIDYQHYDLFVGVYPNDPKTVQSVQAMMKELPHVQCVINPKPGPTNKADNLNAIYQYICEYEKEHGQYDIFVLHDSEDVIHPWGFKFFNYLMPRNAMVQIPIFPLEVGLFNFTHWTYAAEFCEIHTKDIIVREKIGGLVPSAGVGTAFTRDCIQMLTEVRGGLPFSVNTLTEDYSTALQIRLHGLREIFASQYIYHTKWCKKWYFFGPIVPKRTREYIATRALFPMSYTASVRQKTRWILGISFQEWVNTGWTGNLPTLYTLLHDRKAIFTHLITGLFFLLIPFWLLYSLFTAHAPEYPSLQDQFEKNAWVWQCIVISSLMMVNRILQRVIAVTRVYGIIPGLWTIPLILYSNIINLHALLRAYMQFIFAPKEKNTKAKAPSWDKTDHEYPVLDILIGNKLPVGNLLLQHKLIDEKQLAEALDEQGQTGERLGDILVKFGYVTQQQITHLLAQQYHLPILKSDEMNVLAYDKLPKISRFHYDQLLHSHIYPVKINGDAVTIAIRDPSNELKIAKAMHCVKPYEAEFMVLE